MGSCGQVVASPSQQRGPQVRAPWHHGGHGAIDVVGPVASPGRTGSRGNTGVYTDRLKRSLGAVLGHSCTLLRREGRSSCAASRVGWHECLSHHGVSAAPLGGHLSLGREDRFCVSGADARRARSALRKWDDVAPVLARARKAGVACALTETGRRPSDPAQSDLAFSVTREAVTNALRHGQASSIVIAWDHRVDGSLALSVRDDDAPEGITSDPEDDAHLTPATAGTGLTRLERRVRGAGGTFFAGPSEDCWTLRANIPASTSAGVSPVEGGRS